MRFTGRAPVRVLVRDGLLALALIVVGVLGSPRAGRWQRYTGATRLPVRPLAIGCAVAVLGLLGHVLVVASGPRGAGALVGLVPGLAWIAVPFAVGRLVRVVRDSAARSRAEQAQRYAYEERLRIAQEVHDVVGHGLAAINMPARRPAGASPDVHVPGGAKIRRRPAQQAPESAVHALAGSDKLLDHPSGHEDAEWMTGRVGVHA